MNNRVAVFERDDYPLIVRMTGILTILEIALAVLEFPMYCTGNIYLIVEKPLVIIETVPMTNIDNSALPKTGTTFASYSLTRSRSALNY